MMLIVHLRYHHPRSGGAGVYTDTMLANRVDISRESVTVSRHGEQQVLDLPASARDEQICTALGEPYLRSISVEYCVEPDSNGRLVLVLTETERPSGD